MKGVCKQGKCTTVPNPLAKGNWCSLPNGQASGACDKSVCDDKGRCNLQPNPTANGNHCALPDGIVAGTVQSCCVNGMHMD